MTKFNFDEVSQSIPARLPMIEAYLATHKGKKPLWGTKAVFIQHQLGSQVRMTDALIRIGLDPEEIFWVDIPYTANQKVKQALMRLGIPAKNFVKSDYHVGKPYASYQRVRVQKLYMDLQKKLSAGDRLLVLDDGSYFLEAMACHTQPRFRIAIVEQTTRGIIKLAKDAALRHYSRMVPIVNVAESAPKKNLESPFIGKAVCGALVKILRGEVRISPKDRVLVLGYGAIGRSVAQSLETTFHISKKNIYIGDPQKKSKKAALAEGYQLWDRSRTDVKFVLVVGCSGTTSFTLGDRVYLEDGAVLASASSGASELSREEFIDFADSFPADLIYVKNRKDLEKSPINETIEIRLVDRTARFVNGGFPVNFTGNVNSVHPEHIQVTHTLQIGAAVQAVKARLNGVIELDRSLCRMVEKMFGEIYPGNESISGRKKEKL